MRDADPSPLLVLWSRKSRAIPLLPLWAIRPVQSLSACTRVHITFTFLLRNALFWGFTHCVITQKRAILSYFAAEAGNQSNISTNHTCLIYLTNKHELSTDVRTSYTFARFTNLFNFVACYRIFVPKWQT